MEIFLNSILPSIITLLTALGGCKFILTREEKKKQVNEANLGEMENFSYIIKTLRDNMNSMDRRIDALSETNEKYFNELQKHRDEKIKLRDEITELKVEKERLNGLKCLVKGCTKRQPPSEQMM